MLLLSTFIVSLVVFGSEPKVQQRPKQKENNTNKNQKYSDNIEWNLNQFTQSSHYVEKNIVLVTIKIVIPLLGIHYCTSYHLYCNGYNKDSNPYANILSITIHIGFCTITQVLISEADSTTQYWHNLSSQQSAIVIGPASPFASVKCWAEDDDLFQSFKLTDLQPKLGPLSALCQADCNFY